MIRTTKRVETLLSDKTINSTSNDYAYHGRPSPLGGPGPLFGQQYKFTKGEAEKLVKAIGTRFDVATQKRVLKEIQARSSGTGLSRGSVALTTDAARALNTAARNLGLFDLTFLSGQPRPMHPVG